MLQPKGCTVTMCEQATLYNTIHNTSIKHKERTDLKDRRVGSEAAQHLNSTWWLWRPTTPYDDM